jgi:hypothetical protein
MVAHRLHGLSGCSAWSVRVRMCHMKSTEIDMGCLVSCLQSVLTRFAISFKE